MAIERKKLTQTACEKAQPNSKIWDSDVKGFGLFTGKARKTFYYQRDMHGKTVRIKIGNFPGVSSGIARGEALQLAADHATGVAAKRIAASKIPTLRDAMEVYLARGKPSTTLLDLAGVSGSEKRGRGRMCRERAFVERSQGATMVT